MTDLEEDMDPSYQIRGKRVCIAQKHNPDGEIGAMLEPVPGFEPGTSALRKHCSTS